MAAVDLHKVFHHFFFVWMAGVIVLQKVIAQQGSTVEEQYHDPSYFFYQQSDHSRDCKEIQDHCPSNNSSGVYYIKPDGYPEPFQIYCDISEDSAGWTIIQRRIIDGSISFSRGWDDYEKGFGFVSHEYWIGNKRLSYLTNQKNYRLSIDMTLSNGSTVKVSYTNFRIGDEFSKYRLVNVSQYVGTTDAITWASCPDNMVYDSCSCGQRSCQEPTVCQNTCEGDQRISCICPEGFYMNGNDCVPREECGCYYEAEQTVVPEGVTHVNTGCTRVVVCSNGGLTSNEPYECSSDAVCEERDGVRKCYCNDGFSGDGEICTDTTDTTDCMDVYNSGIRTSGEYIIKPTNWPGSPFSVYCNMTEGGGWTVFQRRIDGSVDFFLEWDNYTEGFGDVSQEHWLGNNKIHHLTNQKRYKIRIDLVNRDNGQYYAEYDFFQIDNEEAFFRLSGLGTYSGDADERSNADGFYILSHGRNHGFSTKDRDNDAYSDGNIAASLFTAWWYGSNYAFPSLNGRYSDYFSILHLPGANLLYFSEMKIRPV